MRYSLSLLAFLFVLGTALPAQAQLRDDVKARTQPGQTQLYDSGAPAFSLNRFFSPQHFRMQHTVEMSTGSFGGQTSTLGMYTNTMMWQFSPQLAGRLDVSIANDFSGNMIGSDGSSSRVFIRNAELSYQPRENMNLHFSFRQSPYGQYANPFGYYGPPSRHGAFSPLPPDAF
jgi:hypothetical protein